MGADAWFDRGVNKKRIKEERAKRSGGYRFWLTKGDSAKIVVLEDEPFAVMEHNVEFIDPSTGKKTFSQYTCRRVLEGERCPLCEAGNEPRYMGFVTIIDTRESVSKKNDKVYINQRRILPMVPSVLEWWETAQEMADERDETLTGSMYLFKRSEEGKPGEPSIGGSRDYVKHVDLKNYMFTDKDGKEHVPKPFDFQKLMYPRSGSDLSVVVAKMLNRSSSKEEDDTSKDESWSTDAEGGDDDTSYT